ncbi:MAG: hypothetical protein HC871_15755, partial [Rhizobiales bacterium]|nr:hypothetical protein [Hyphomicrobiales bacterium]
MATVELRTAVDGRDLLRQAGAAVEAADGLLRRAIESLRARVSENGDLQAGLIDRSGVGPTRSPVERDLSV